jgi:type 1 fimbria pilin
MLTCWTLGGGGGILSLGIMPAFAQINCIATDADSPRTDIIQLSPPTISVGVDMPNGTVLYRGSWFSGSTGGTSMSCRSSSLPATLTYSYNIGIQQAPLPLADWSGSPFAGRVYQTGIPGIGVAISDGARAVTLDTLNINAGSRTSELTKENNGSGINIQNSTRYISLIKIGTISPGSYKLGSGNLPSVKMFFDNANSTMKVIGLPIVANILQFQGELNVEAKTCKTADVHVPMGSYETTKYFKGEGTATPWVDASIILSDCPVFHGYYNNKNTLRLLNYDTGEGKFSASTNNKVGVFLSPLTGVVDIKQGVMGVNSDRNEAAANGVGIQIGWGDYGNNPVPFDFMSEKHHNLVKDGRKIIRIPLSARYIQTDPIVTPGRADGKLTFTINYY